MIGLAIAFLAVSLSMHILAQKDHESRLKKLEEEMKLLREYFRPDK